MRILKEAIDLNDLSRISVVLPSLDPDEKLVAVVDGLLEYGFTDIILVNDGSKPEGPSTRFARSGRQTRSLQNVLEAHLQDGLHMVVRQRV